MDITLAWDANTEADLAGYIVYSKTGSSPSKDSYNRRIIICNAGAQWPLPCDSVLSTPNSLEYEVSNVSDSEPTFFAVTAFDESGNEGGFSNEVVYQPPLPLALSGLSITGPESVEENSSANYAAVATFSDGSTQTVTSLANWSESSQYANIEAGVLTTTEVESDQSVTITASYIYNDVGVEAVFVLQIIDGQTLPQPPVADAGPDQSVNEGDVVTLSASNSTDPDNDIASYLWTQTAGPQITLSSPTSEQPTFTAPEVDPDGVSLTFQLEVKDEGGLQSTDTCIVNVSWVNLPPKADAGPDQILPEGTMVTLDGSNSVDPDDGIASYHWVQKTGSPVTLDDPTVIYPTFTAPDVRAEGESLAFELIVTDTGGLQSSDSCVVNVSWVNEPPIADAGPDQSIAELARVRLDGSKSMDTDDGIASYRWSQRSGSPVTIDDPTAVQTTFTAPDVGTEAEGLSFQLTVTDTGSLQSTDSCTVTVAEGQALTASVSKLELARTYTTGKGKNRRTIHELTDVFVVGDSVKIQAYLEDEKGSPVPDATVSLQIMGPQNATVTTKPSDAYGIAKAKWSTNVAKNKRKKSRNTTSGTYTISVTKIAAEGYSWDGVIMSAEFIIQ